MITTKPGMISSLEISRTNLDANTYYYPTSEGILLSPTITGLSIHLSVITDCTITFERSLDGTNWLDITDRGYALVNDPSYSSYVAANLIDYEGLQGGYFRVKQVTVDGSNQFDMCAFAAAFDDYND